MKTDFMSVLNAVTKFEENAKIEEYTKIKENTKEAEPVIDFSLQEKKIIGYILSQAMSNRLIEIDFLTEKHFQNDFYGVLYQYCLDCQKNDEIVTLSNVVNDFLQSEPKGQNYIRGLIFEAKDYPKEMILNFAYSIDEYFKTTQIKEAINNLADSLKNFSRFSEVKKSLSNFSQLTAKLTYSPLAEKVVYTHEEALEAFEKEFNSKDTQRIPTLLKPLDDIIGGLGRGELIVCGGRPGMGKTAFSIHLQSVIAENNFCCLSFNFEMSNNQNASRFISRDSYMENNFYSVPYNKFMKKEGSPEYFQKAFDASKKRKKQITHNYGNLSIDEIVSFSVQHAHSLSRENKKLDFIVIDYLQIIKMQNKRDAHLEIGEITGKLKQLAKMLNCAVLCLSQLNRAIEGIGDKRPVLQHLRQSGKIEEDADIVLFPYRPSYYERDTDEFQREWCEDYFEIIVEKNRVGNKGIAKIKCNMAVNFFENGEFDQKSDNAGRTGNVRKSDSKRQY